jgi:hypothetical protein
MKTRSLSACAAVGALFFVVPGGDAQPPAAAGLMASAVLRADQPGPVVNKNVYGHFAEHLGRGIYEGIWVGPGARPGEASWPSRGSSRRCRAPDPDRYAPAR